MNLKLPGRFAVIGAGRIGSGFAKLLVTAGHTLTAVYDSDPLKAQALLRSLHVNPALPADDIASLPAETELFLITVPDDSISLIANEISNSRIIITSQCFLHASGALSSQLLQPIAKCGGSIGSLHPLRAVPDPEHADEALKGAVFSFEGDSEVRRFVDALVSAAGGSLLTIRAEDKPLYHAIACMVANYVVTMTAVADNTWATLGLTEGPRRQAIRDLAIDSIINSTLRSPNEALTGPLVRGDTTTIRLHLAALHQAGPSIHELYILLGKLTVGLLAQNADRILQILDDAG